MWGRSRRLRCGALAHIGESADRKRGLFQPSTFDNTQFWILTRHSVRTGSKRVCFATHREYSSRFAARQKLGGEFASTFPEGAPRDRHSPCRDHHRQPIARLKTKWELGAILAARWVISPMRSPRPRVRRDWIRASCQKEPAIPFAGHISRYYVGGPSEVRTDKKY